MREILFRGKRISNSKWVEGFMYSQHFPLEFRDDFYIRCYDTDYLVIPETVGQYTGLTDKNGVKIFEGDICRFKRFNDICVGKIIFNVTTASFVMWYQSIVGAYGEKAAHKMLLSVCDNIEVIGNIHDNSELLKGGEDNG